MNNTAAANTNETNEIGAIFSKAYRADSRIPAVGSILARDYKGRAVEVEVVTGGFLFESRHYNTLSPIAKEIAGCESNGYAFFGLANGEPKVKVARRAKAAKVVVIAEPETAPENETAPPVKANGPRHAMYSTLLYYVSRRRHTYLFGPMGSGKSHAASQVAAELGLRFAYVSLNPQSPASLLNGFIDAQGRFSSTEFYNCYMNGGIFCIDELDNASASLLTTLNSALANGHASFPCGMVARHKNFVLIATGNTTGRGGDWQYPERRKIDEATMDRLTMIEWGYDVSLEDGIWTAINPEAGPWVDWVRTVRAWIARRENGVKGGVYATPRAMFAGAEDLAHAPESITLSVIANGTVFKGLDADTRARITNACPLPSIR